MNISSTFSLPFSLFHPPPHPTPALISAARVDDSRVFLLFAREGGEDSKMLETKGMTNEREKTSHFSHHTPPRDAPIRFAGFGKKTLR